MTRIALADIEANPFDRAMGNRPEILAAWSELDTTLLGPSSTVAVEVKEEARRALAQDVGCRFCATVGGLPADEPADAQHALAVAFANQLTADHREIDDAMFAALREEFSDEQIVELVAWLCFKFGANLFGALIQLDPASEQQVDSYTAFLRDVPVES
jgi:alkylhydroperoxidase family enzyme